MMINIENMHNLIAQMIMEIKQNNKNRSSCLQNIDHIFMIHSGIVNRSPPFM